MIQFLRVGCLFNLGYLLVLHDIRIIAPKELRCDLFDKRVFSCELLLMANKLQKTPGLELST